MTPRCLKENSRPKIMGGHRGKKDNGKIKDWHRLKTQRQNKRLAPTKDTATPKRLAPTKDTATPKRLAPTKDTATPKRLAPTKDTVTPKGLAPTKDTVTPKGLALTKDTATPKGLAPTKDRGRCVLLHGMLIIHELLQTSDGSYGVCTCTSCKCICTCTVYMFSVLLHTVLAPTPRDVSVFFFLQINDNIKPEDNLSTDVVQTC